MSKPRQLVVFGDNTADEILSAVARIPVLEFERVGKHFFDKRAPSNRWDQWRAHDYETFFIVGIADVELRKQVIQFAESQSLTPFSVIDPTAVVDRSASIAPGCFVAAQVVISCRAALSSHTLVHFGASIGHDAHIGVNSVILPGARISGLVKIGSDVLVGSNSFVYQGVQVGDSAKIDAMTYVRENLGFGRTISVRRGG